MRSAHAYRLCIFTGFALIALLTRLAFWQTTGAPGASLARAAAAQSVPARGEGSHSGAEPAPGQIAPADPLLSSADLQMPGTASPEQEEAIRQTLQSLLARSPKEALEWVKQARDPQRLEQLTCLTARLWAAMDPERALDWAQSLEGPGRESVIQAALAGMAAQPATGVRLSLELLHREPGMAAERGRTFLEALTGTGQFSAAALFAAQAPGEFRADWTRAAFARWANERPEAAAAFLAEVREPELRASAFEAVVKGWAQRKPAGLADFAVALPTGPERAFALDEASRRWCLQDPADMARWLSRVGYTLEFDRSKAILVNQTDSMNRDPKEAMQWAESIGDPELRFDSISHVLRELAMQDRNAAEGYIQSASEFDPAQRESLRQSLEFSP